MHLLFVLFVFIFSSPGASSLFGLSIGMEGIAGREFFFWEFWFSGLYALFIGGVVFCLFSTSFSLLLCFFELGVPLLGWFQFRATPLFAGHCFVRLAFFVSCSRFPV